MAISKFLALINGKPTQTTPATTGGAAAAGQIPALNTTTGLLDITMMPTGVGVSTQSVTTSEALAAGAFVNLYNNAGALNARNADGTNPAKEAHGFVLAAVASGASATVYTGSGTNTSCTGLTAGMDVFLSDTTVGAATNTAPSTSGHLLQQIGVAISATTVQFTPGQTFTL